MLDYDKNHNHDYDYFGEILRYRKCNIITNRLLTRLKLTNKMKEKKKKKIIKTYNK